VSIISILLMLPPPLIALFASWMAARKRSDTQDSGKAYKTKGALITTFFAVLYFGFLAFLAVVNLARHGNSPGPIFTYGILLLLMVVLTAICLGIFALGYRAFVRERKVGTK